MSTSLDKARYAAIVCEARKQGFALVGAARLQHLDCIASYRSWLAQGRHASMAYLARHLQTRADPRHRFPWAQSILCVAMPYGKPVVSKGLLPRIARYAHGLDYHLVMEQALKRLTHAIISITGIKQLRYYVDTGPILEKQWAYQAGLGWIGKNTLLCNQDWGSFLVLGEILLPVSLPPAQPQADLCGDCTACLQACPTGALVAPYQLDARRCLAFLTIESRVLLPPSLRSAMAGGLFGCDRCQEVCPWNQKRKCQISAVFEPRAVYQQLDLEDIIDISGGDFQNIFYQTALWRARREGLRRNAILAAGAEQHQRAYRAIKKALSDGDDTIRTAAAWALAQYASTHQEELE